MPAKPTTLSSAPAGAGVDSALLEKATVALLKHHEDTISKNKSKESLLPKSDDVPVQVQLTLSRVPENSSPKPIRIDIPHPFHKPPSNMDVDDGDEYLEEAEVCLIVKDDDKDWIKQLISKVGPESSLSCIKKVLGLTSLRKKHSQFSDKRALLQKFDFFLADDRILPMLSKNLGKSFFKAKKQPIPIDVTRKSALPFVVDKCLKATWMFISAGTCITIKVGDTGMTLNNLLANFEAIITNAAMRVPRKWANIQAISIKTSQSVALPVYNKTKEDLEEIAKMAGILEENESKKRLRESVDETDSNEKKRLKELATQSTLSKALKKVKENQESNKKKKKKSSSSVGNEIEKSNENGKKEISNKKLKTPKKQEEPKSSKKEKKTRDEEPKSSKKEMKERKTPKKQEELKSSKKVKKTKDEEPKEQKKEFIESKKFIGSKKGYKFQKGKLGVGYYVDVPPVPDKMALAAFARLAQGGGSGRRGKSKTPKKRGRR